MDIFQFCIVQYARRTSCFSLGLRLAVSIFQFWIVYHISLWLGLVLDIFQFWNVYRIRKKDFVFLARVRVIFQFWIVYHTLAQERNRGSRCG